MRHQTERVALLVLRGGAIFLGVFTLVGLIGELRGRTADVNLWWVDVHDLPGAVRIGLLGTFGGLLFVWGVRSAPGRRWTRAVGVMSAVFAVLALRDCLRFVAAAAGGLVHPALPVPLSIVISLVLALLAFVVLRAPAGTRPDSRGTRAAVLVATLGWAIAFPLAQMLFFGTTDYRRPADAAVVFGARVYANGRPSPLLADRIRAGVELNRAGLAPVLVMSGGDGADGFNEALVMRDEAIAQGVDPAAILVDRAGVSTEATVANAMTMLEARSGDPRPGVLRLMAVSQAYHLPRVQLAFAAAGIDVLTVPAAEAQPIGEMPFLIAREIPAFWAYFVRVNLF